MSSKRPSQLLMIRISLGGVRRLVIPVPLYVLDLTLAAFSEVACLADSLVPNGRRRLCGQRLGHSARGRVSVEALLSTGLRLFHELRKYGRWRMVEVRAGRVRVFVDFY